MNCHLIVHTECCAHNCLKAEEKNTSVDEYEAVSSDEESEEEIDTLSTKTMMG
jgi:hypothetical protein